MIAQVEMLVEAAKTAGISVPPDIHDYDPSSYPHWHVFCTAQVGASMPDGSAHRDNARIIAAIPLQALKRIKLRGLEKRGFKIGYSK